MWDVNKLARVFQAQIIKLLGKRFKQRIYGKLMVNNRSQAVARLEKLIFYDLSYLIVEIIY